MCHYAGHVQLVTILDYSKRRRRRGGGEEEEEGKVKQVGEDT